MEGRWGLPAVAVALLLGVAGCYGNALSAPNVRSPVMFGPVACIGCGAVARPPVGPLAVHVVGRWQQHTVWVPPPGPAMVIRETEQDSRNERLLSGIPCVNDIQLVHVRADALGAFIPFLVAGAGQDIEGYAWQVNVPEAACPPL